LVGLFLVVFLALIYHVFVFVFAFLIKKGPVFSNRLVRQTLLIPSTINITDESGILLENSASIVEINNNSYIIPSNTTYHITVVEPRIFQLDIDDIVGDIDQENRTITFRVFGERLNNDNLQGIITELNIAEGEDTVFFFTAWQEWPRRQGEGIEFADGDLVYVASSLASGTIVYTIIIEIIPPKGVITLLRLGSLTGIIDQEAATITFNLIRPHPLFTMYTNFGFLRLPVLEFRTDPDADSLLFFIEGEELELKVDRDNVIDFRTGDLVYMPDGYVYTIIFSLQP